MNKQDFGFSADSLNLQEKTPLSRVGKFIVSGATGFLGRNLFRRLKEDGLSVHGFSQKNENGEKGIERVDLRKFSEVADIIRRTKPDIIYHLGALVDLSRDFEIAKKCIDINIKGTLNLLEACRYHTPKRVIFTSTEEVYGEGKMQYKENQVLHPPSPYAISKLAGEYLCEFYAKLLRMELVIVRIGTMYGPGQPADRFIPQIIIKALKNESIQLPSGEKKRDYVYVEDIVEGLILAGKANLKKSTITLNLGSGHNYSLKELVSEIMALTQSSSVPMFGILPDRPLEASEWLMDIEKARKVLDWKAKIELSSGLSKTVRYFKEEVV